MTLSEFRALLLSDKVIDIILDTDTYNEIDDQYALAYAMLSKKKINLLSVNAAPFFNSRSSSAAEGMEKSYNEIFNIMKLTDAEMAEQVPVYRGSTRFMTSKTDIVESDACDNIINTVMSRETPVIIVAVGAITNVASAQFLNSRISTSAVVLVAYSVSNISPLIRTIFMFVSLMYCIILTNEARNTLRRSSLFSADKPTKGISRWISLQCKNLIRVVFFSLIPYSFG